MPNAMVHSVRLYDFSSDDNRSSSMAVFLALSKLIKLNLIYPDIKLILYKTLKCMKSTPSFVLADVFRTLPKKL